MQLYVILYPETSPPHQKTHGTYCSIRIEPPQDPIATHAAVGETGPLYMFFVFTDALRRAASNGGSYLLRM